MCKIYISTVVQEVMSNLLSILISSAADPFHIDTDPDHWIRFVETRLRIMLQIRPKIEKKNYFYNFFILITHKMIYYYINLENINSNEKKS